MDGGQCKCRPHHLRRDRVDGGRTSCPRQRGASSERAPRRATDSYLLPRTGMAQSSRRVNRNVRAYIRARVATSLSRRNELVKIPDNEMDNEDRFKPLEPIKKIAELIRPLTYSEVI